MTFRCHFTPKFAHRAYPSKMFSHVTAHLKHFDKCFAFYETCNHDFDIAIWCRWRWWCAIFVVGISAALVRRLWSFCKATPSRSSSASSSCSMPASSLLRFCLISTPLKVSFVHDGQSGNAVPGPPPILSTSFRKKGAEDGSFPEELWVTSARWILTDSANVLAPYFGASASHFDDCKVPLQRFWRDSVTIIFAFVIIIIIIIIIIIMLWNVSV